MELPTGEADSTKHLTIRLIRSFEYRNWKPLVLVKISFEWTTDQLTDYIRSQIKESKLRDVFKNYGEYDTLKIECHPHQSKGSDPLINLSDDPSLILKPGLKLSTQGVRNGTEISYFKGTEYLKYKKEREPSTMFH